MPIHHVQKMLMVSPDYSYKEKYWTILSNYVEENYGRDEIKSSILVQKILKECFTLLGEQFVNLIKSQNKASFYLYAHNFHENSGELWKQQLEGIKLSIDEEEFAGTRRVLKIILEQSCGIELVGTPNFNNEMYQNRFQYLKLLEELLYIGHWAIALSEYIARSQLFPKSIGISVVNHELNILTYSPYNLLYDFIHQDLKRHNDGVVINNTLKDFNVILKKSLGLDFHVIAAVVNEQLINSQYRHGVLQIEQLIDLISNDKGYDKDKLRDYYAGLTLTNYNFMSFENCILRNQDINRHTYRPILQMRIDNKEYCLIGRNKWLESLTLISTNAIPYGICATEWKKYKDIRKFIDNMSNNHDKILEKPLIE